jgi:uncharacterized cupredoxin-like copper-binding protein
MHSRLGLGVLIAGFVLDACAATPVVPTPSAIATAVAPPSPTQSAATASQAPSASLQPSPSGPQITGSFEEAAKAPAGAVTIVMTDNLPGSYGPAYAPNTATVSASNAVFFLQNTPRVFAGQHNFILGPKAGQRLVGSPAINADKSGVFTVTGLQPGTYVFYCTIPDPVHQYHYLDGMVGTLTVTP